jgi:hypothetical protein
MNGADDGPGENSRTDLDSHANMPVVCSGAHVLVDHNRTFEVSSYSPDVIDSAMASATARFASGVSPEHLSKI